jgi:hypothetical protein
MNYRFLSTFLVFLNFLKSLLRALCLLIQKSLTGILALALPCLLPIPLCLPIFMSKNSILDFQDKLCLFCRENLGNWIESLPFCFSARCLLALALEWVTTFFLTIKPSLTSFLIDLPVGLRDISKYWI